jgi:hypothetical protein
MSFPKFLNVGGRSNGVLQLRHRVNFNFPNVLDFVPPSLNFNCGLNMKSGYDMLALQPKNIYFCELFHLDF